MNKNNLYYIILIFLPLITFSQGETNVITGDELRRVFFLDYNHDDNFDNKDFRFERVEDYITSN